MPPYYVIYAVNKKDSWINVTDILEFLPETMGDLPETEAASKTISFIVANDDTGWMHLYLITAKLYDPPTLDITAEEFHQRKS